MHEGWQNDRTGKTKTLPELKWEMAYKKEWMELREAIRQEITARGGRTR